MERREDLRGSARRERVHVGEDRGRNEGWRQLAEVGRAQAALPSEVAGQKRQHEEA